MAYFRSNKPQFFRMLNRDNSGTITMNDTSYFTWNPLSNAVLYAVYLILIE